MRTIESPEEINQQRRRFFGAAAMSETALNRIDAGLLNVGYAEAGAAGGPAVMLLHRWSGAVFCLYVGLLALAINIAVSVVLNVRLSPRRKLAPASRISVTILLVLAAGTYATMASADDEGSAKPSPPVAVQSAPCDSIHDFIATNCVLSRYGLTLYGTLDMGGTWQSHGVPFNSNSSVGDEYLLSKNGNRAQWNLAPNALSQSVIGIRGNEPLPDWASDLAFVFDLEAGFDPYSFKLADGPSSVAGDRGVPLNQQDANADSSRAGQFYNSLGYLGVSSPTYGTLTIFRQNSLTLDGVIAYDPLGASYAFSPIGYQGTACGGGDTEDCRYSTALKYRVNVGPLHAAALYQFGGYDLNNGAQGAYQLEAGGDVREVAGGTLSADLSITHNFRSDHGAQRDVRQPR
jgi:hypothetical protein